MLADAAGARDALRLVKLFVEGELRLPGATRRVARERERLFGGGRTRGFLPYLGMCEDAADGTLALEPSGALELQWDPAASAESFRELEGALRELSDVLHGEYVPSPLSFTGDLLTAHPLGGCRMAADPSDGVVDHRCEVHGYPGLFVVDGSVVPTALSRNPSATISALAERAAYLMIHGRELHAAHGVRPKRAGEIAHDTADAIG